MLFSLIFCKTSDSANFRLFSNTYINFGIKIGWGTVWAIFSQSHTITLTLSSVFQIRYLQTNYFLMQLIEVLSEESNRDDNLATDNSCTISNYDDSEDDTTAADLVYSCSCTSDLVTLQSLYVWSCLYARNLSSCMVVH
jgi:hypothetical protein